MYKIFIFVPVHPPYFRHKAEVQTGGAALYCCYEEIKQYFAKGDYILMFYRGGQVRPFRSFPIKAINAYVFKIPHFD